MFIFILKGFTLSATNSREQAIDQYKALLKKKRDLTRKNRAVQTKIAQYVRKHKIDLTGNVDLAETSYEEDVRIYNGLLDKLKNITYDKAQNSRRFKSLMHNSILKGKRNETIYWGFGRLWSQNEEGGLSGADNALDIYF